jgi:hypothetical protein
MLRTALGAVLALVILAPPAAAETQHGHGRPTPAQVFAGSSASGDWVGAYMIDGKQSFGVLYGYPAPTSTDRFQPDDGLRDKWGAELPEPVAAKISYLLLQYGDTTNDDEAAALAHVMHAWTAAPRAGRDDLSPARTQRDIGYDAELHFTALPDSAKAAVDMMMREAETQAGPWIVKVTAPTEPQQPGVADVWTVTVDNPEGKGLGSIPLMLNLTDATLAGGRTTANLHTPADGGALTVAVTPTGPTPALTIKLTAPAARPVVQRSAEPDTQRVLRSGGKTTLIASARAGLAEASDVPQAIPAGPDAPATASAKVVSSPHPIALAVLGGLLLITSGIGALVWRRRVAGRR